MCVRAIKRHNFGINEIALAPQLSACSVARALQLLPTATQKRCSQPLTSFSGVGQFVVAHSTCLHTSFLAFGVCARSGACAGAGVAFHTLAFALFRSDWKFAFCIEFWANHKRWFLHTCLCIYLYKQWHLAKFVGFISTCSASSHIIAGVCAIF